MATLLGGDRWNTEEDDHSPFFWREDYEEQPDDKNTFFHSHDDDEFSVDE